MNPCVPSRFRPECESLEDRLLPSATTFVSTAGDDTNDGSRTMPCKTFVGANAATPPGGEIDVLDPGDFGTLTVTKALTIDGGGFTAGVLASGTNGIVVDAGPNDVVVLRGLDFNGLGTGLSGIKIVQAAAVYVENCTIQEFTGPGIDFEPDTNCQLFVTNTIVRHNGIGGKGLNQAGIFVQPTNGATALATIDQSQMDTNLNGLEADNNSQVTVSNSQAAGNSNLGFLAMSATGPVQLTLNNDTEANNGLGAFQAVGAGATITVLPSTPPAATPAPLLTPALPPGSLASTTTLTVVAVGNQSLLTVTVSGPGSALVPATGIVLFLDGDQLVGFETLVNGKASRTIPRSHHRRLLQVIYLGDSNFAMSESLLVALRANHLTP
jgi:hypothetical protein